MRRARLGGWLRLAVVVIKPMVLLLTTHSWRGAAELSRSGGVIVAANHISYADPFPLALFVYDAGRLPRFLCKAEAFRLPLAGRLLRGAGQIPVYRHTPSAAGAVRAAVAAVRAGECVVIYPEGTLTHDPQLWPMEGRTGVARLALETGAPVIPVAQWGAQEILRPGSRRLRLLPRHHTTLHAGPPVDLSAYAGTQPTREVLRAVTDLVMEGLRDALAEIRAAQPPAQLYAPPGPAGVAQRRPA